jgi:RNA polymerase sigma factor (sigma-70 family)
MDLENSRSPWIELLDKLIWEETPEQLARREKDLPARLSGEGLRLRDVLQGLPSDETLALAIQKGFLYKEAFEELFVNRCQRYLLSWFYRWHHDPDLARELMQRLYCKFLEKGLPSFSPSRNFRSYLYQSAWNLSVDHARQGKRAAPLDATPEPYSKSPPPEQEAAGKEMAERLEGALHHLPASEQRVLRLTLAGRSADEISGETSLPKRRVFALLFRARRAVEHELHLPGPSRPSGRSAARADSSL